MKFVVDQYTNIHCSLKLKDYQIYKIQNKNFSVHITLITINWPMIKKLSLKFLSRLGHKISKRMNLSKSTDLDKGDDEKMRLQILCFFMSHLTIENYKIFFAVIVH